MTKVVSWNVSKRQEPWRQLLKMDADVALLQEAGEPPADVADRLGVGKKEHWDSHCCLGGHPKPAISGQLKTGHFR